MIYCTTSITDIIYKKGSYIQVNNNIRLKSEFSLGFPINIQHNFKNFFLQNVFIFADSNLIKLNKINCNLDLNLFRKKEKKKH